MSTKASANAGTGKFESNHEQGVQKMKGSNAGKGSSQTENFDSEQNTEPLPFLFSMPGEPQDCSADRILRFLQISANPELRQQAMNALLHLLEKSPTSDTVIRNCAQALFVQMKLQQDPQIRAEFIKKLETLRRKRPNDPEILYTCTQAAVHELEICRTQSEAHLQLEALRRFHVLAAKHGFATEKICRLLAHGISQFLQRQRVAGKMEALLLELKHLADSSPKDLKISEEYVRGVASIMRNVREPEERNAWFDALEKFTERETLTAEMRAGILEGGTHWLLVRLAEYKRTLKNASKENAPLRHQKTVDCMRIQSLLHLLWCEESQNTESRYFFACALLASMQGEANDSKRKEWAQTLSKCRSVRLTELDELYRTCRNEFLANEWNEEVRSVILAALR